MFAKRRVRQAGHRALRRLLPLLLPAGRTGVTHCQTEALQSGFWVAAARQRGLAPAFHVFLRTHECRDALPAVAQEQLEAAYQENLANVMIREAVLGEILSLFRPLGETPILLKGLAFAHELYPEPAARLVGDIDLLVPAQLKEEAYGRLQAAGFRRLSVPPRPPGWFKSLLRSANWDPAATNAGSDDAAPAADAEGEAVFLTRAAGQDVLVEVHHHLINLRAGGGKEGVFRSRVEALPSVRTTQFPAGQVRILDPDAAFLHALRHLALHHRLIGFRWHHDLALMLACWETSLDPDSIRSSCRSLNSEKILRVELAILRELFGESVLSATGWGRWQVGKLPWEYPLYRHVACLGRRTPWRELVRTFLAPGLREQLETLT